MKRIDIDHEPEQSDIDAIAAVLRRGGVAVLPTDTIYGYHALANDTEAIESIFRIKTRDAGRPLLVLCSWIGQLGELGVSSPPETIAALDRIWPAPLTAILPIAEPIAASAGTRSVGIRIPDVAWLRQLVTQTGPLASTSLNRSGETPVADLFAADQTLLRGVDLTVIGHRLNGQPSTVVDFTETLPRVLREGAFGFTQNLWKMMWKSL